MKKLLALLLAAVMCMGLVACGGNPTPSSEAPSEKQEESTEAEEKYEPITIQFWNGWTGSDGQVLIELVERFNKENKWNITVEMDMMADFRDKITPAMAAHKAPALILGSCSEKYTYEGQVRKMDDIFEKTDLKEENFISSYLDSLRTDDGLYGIPFQISNYCLYWNKDLFKAAGLDPETPPKTYDEWTEFAQKITDPDKHIYGSGLSYSNIGADACLMQMFGGLQVTEEDGKWVAHFANNQGYIDFVNWFNLQFQNGSNPVEADMDTMFVSGQLGMYVQGAWLLADVHKYNLNYGLTTLIETPEGGKQAPANTQCFFVTSDATEEQALAAYRFIDWWHEGNGEGVTDIKDTGVYWWSDKIGYPTYYIPVANMKEYQENKDMNAITITDPAYCMDSVAPGNFKYWQDVLVGPLMDFFSNLTFEDQKPIEEVLDQCQKGADEIIKKGYGY